MTSPRSDVQNESISDIRVERRSSNQSLVSGIATIPTMGSAFTDLFKQNVNTILFSFCLYCYIIILD
jgi:hypothetical protein